MPPYDPYQEAWSEDSVTRETHIDVESDGAARINNAKDHTRSIISNLDARDPYQVKDFYDTEKFASRYGQESDMIADRTFTMKTSHTTPTIKEGQRSDFCVCPCCQLPRAPSSTPTSPLSPHLHHTPKDICCACYCPDISMPKDILDSPPNQKPHIHRRSSLSNKGLGDWH